MSKKKAHLFVWDPAPNESDPAGEEYAMCGNDVSESGSHHVELVTCRRCLKRHAKAKLESRS